MINLTSSALMLYEDELPTEKTSRSNYLQLVTCLQGYKKAFTNNRVWTTVSQRLGTIFEIVCQTELQNNFKKNANLHIY